VTELVIKQISYDQVAEGPAVAVAFEARAFVEFAWRYLSLRNYKTVRLRVNSVAGVLSSLILNIWHNLARDESQRTRLNRVHPPIREPPEEPSIVYANKCRDLFRPRDAPQAMGNGGACVLRV
jgi:hypothetical protein